MKSMILTNGAGGTLTAGAVIPLGSAIHGFGRSIKLNNNAINIYGNGYYKVSAAITTTATAAGPISATMYVDGVAVPGTTTSAVAAAVGDIITLYTSWIVRKCDCPNNPDTITFEINDATNVNNITVIVEAL